MRYQLLAESTNIKLQNDVDKLLKAEWELYGDPFYSDGIFFQAVIKRNGKEKKAVTKKE